MCGIFGGGIVIETSDGPKTHVFPYVYTPYLVLIAIFHRNSVKKRLTRVMDCSSKTLFEYMRRL